MIEVDTPVPQERRQNQPLMVTVSMGFKRNLGNYEMMDVHVGITAPSRQGETAAQAFDRVYAFVENKLVEKFEETEEAVRNQGLGEGD